MKKTTKILDRVTTVLLMAVCLFSMAVPAAAADPTTVPEDIRYGIVIECSYSDIEDSDTADPSIYEENIFLLSSKASELYAIAEYSEEKQTYVVSDYTADRDNATQFRCGTNGKLLISDLAQDIYILEHIDTLSGYITIVDAEIILSSAGIAVDGQTQNSYVNPQNGEITVSVAFSLHKGYVLPDICGSCRFRTALVFAAIALLAGLVLIALFFLRKKKSHEPDNAP